jgi:hypothetical protein
MKKILESPALWIVLCVAALTFRVTLGVDLGDESYYAAFVDGWLKTGLADNTFLMIHQTADLVVYPFAVLYHQIRGDSEGLVLFLRLIYLGIATASSTCLYQAVAPYRGRAVATLAAILALLFIPFSLPAPSYNTIGMYALIGALSLFASGFNEALATKASSKPASLSRSLWLSGAWWAVGCVAYPPMLAPLVALCMLSLLFFRTGFERRLVLRYAIACCVLLSIAFVMLCAALGLDHLSRMLRFTNAFNNVSGGVGGKLKTAADAFAAHPRFALICAAAVFVAAMRCLPAPGWQTFSNVVTGLLVVGVATSPAATFYSRTHDLVLVLAVSGVLVSCRQLILGGTDLRTRVFALISTASFIGGLTTAATAFNGLFNFPVGGFLAACLALVLQKLSTRSARAVRLIALGVACCAMAATAFGTYYGQIGAFSYGSSVRVRHGAFAGLRTDAEQASFIAQLTEAIEQQRGCGNKFAVFGTGPGFYLLTTMLPTTLSTWNYPGDARNFATDTVKAFYEVPANRPDVLVLNNWQWATPLSASDRTLLERYALSAIVRVGIREASVYRRVDCPGG